MLSSTDPNGLVTTDTYDALGRVTESRVGARRTLMAYDTAGNLVSRTTPDGRSLSFAYDAAQRLQSVTDGPGNQVLFNLDLMSNLIALEVRGASGLRTRYRTWTYDKANNPASTTSAGGAVAKISFGPDGVQYSSANELGMTTVMTPDRFGRAVSSFTQLPSGTPYLFGESIDYDDVFRRTQFHIDGYAGVPHLAYAYDEIGNQIGFSGIQHAGQLGSSPTDAAGNVTSTTDATGQQLDYSYDALNRLVRVTPHGASAPLFSYTYDQADAGHGFGIGHLTSMTDPSGTTDWTYDIYGAVVRKVQQFTSGRSTTVTYAYDALSGNLVARQVDTLPAVTYAWSNGLVTSIAVGNVPVVSNITYQPFGPVKAWTYGNGVTAGFTYDLDGRPTSDPVSSLIGYDAANRVTSVTNTGVLAGVRSYGYDVVDRVIGYNGPGPLSREYAYDYYRNLSREVTFTGAPTNFNLLAGTTNQIGSLSANGASTPIGYDGNGKVTSLLGSSFGYDVAGRMVQATGPGVDSAVYAVNGLQQRSQKTVTTADGLQQPFTQVFIVAPETQTTNFVYDEQGHLVSELNNYSGSKGQIQHIYLDDMPVAVVDGSDASGVYYVRPDYRGTPRQIDNSTGVPVWAWDPLVYGDNPTEVLPVSNPGPITNVWPGRAPRLFDGVDYNLRFPGQYYDAETGTHYNGYRTYSPDLKRYLQPDPAGVAGGWNAYSYVGGNPVSNVDPTGEYGIGGFFGGMAFNFAVQFGTNLIQSDFDFKRSIRCVNWADVAISGAIGAIAPTFLSQVLRGKPGPLGFSRGVETFNWAARALPAGYAVKRVMPDFKIATDDCECQGLSLGGLLGEILH